MKTNCPHCNAPKDENAGIWNFFGCGTDVDQFGKSRQSMACLTIQRDNLLKEIIELRDHNNELLIKISGSK